MALLGAGPAKEKVLILPFESADANARDVWIGRGIQQNLKTDFSRAKLLVPIAPQDAKPAGDEAEALKAAQAAGARYVILGSFQTMDGNLRITGLRATGMTRDLFLLEDTIADQARRVLPHESVPNPPPPAKDLKNQAEPLQGGQQGRGFNGSDLEQATLGGPYSGSENYNRYQYNEPVYPYYPYYNYTYAYPAYYQPPLTVYDVSNPFPSVTVVNINNRSRRDDCRPRGHERHDPPPAPSVKPPPTPQAYPTAPVNRDLPSNQLVSRPISVDPVTPGRTIPRQ
jgi:TolB-like protein